MADEAPGPVVSRFGHVEGVLRVVVVSILVAAPAWAQLSPSDAAAGLAGGSVAQTLAWVAIVLAIAVGALARALWASMNARVDELRAQTAALVESKADAAVLAHKLTAAVGELKEISELFHEEAR